MSSMDTNQNQFLLTLLTGMSPLPGPGPGPGPVAYIVEAYPALATTGVSSSADPRPRFVWVGGPYFILIYPALPSPSAMVRIESDSPTDYADHVQSYPPWMASLLNNGEVRIIPTDGEFISGYGMTGNSPVRQREFIDMSNSLPNHAAPIQSQHSQRPAASLNNPFGNDEVVINIPSDGYEARATGDYEAAGHSKFFKATLPAAITIAYEVLLIYKSISNNSLPLSAEILGYLTGGIAVASVISSLAGLSLSTFKPRTLPFGCNPQRMMQIMHNVSAHATAYAFISTMGYEFLQDDPTIMWPTLGLAYGGFTGLMTFIGRRRGQGTFSAGAVQQRPLNQGDDVLQNSGV